MRRLIECLNEGQQEKATKLIHKIMKELDRVSLFDIFIAMDQTTSTKLGLHGITKPSQFWGTDPEKLREWHWMWSTFYFYKKNYGFFYALKKTMGKLLRSFVKMIYYYT